MKFKLVLLALLTSILCLGIHYVERSPAIAIARTDWASAVFPLKMADFQGYTSPYGWRVHPISGERKMHYGLDIGADEGKELRNWWTGKVIKVVQNPSSGCGNEITVQSGSWESRSCHLQKTLVEEGQQVKSGDIIGLVGQTGGVTGPHLHWELYYKGDILNPGEVIVAMQKAKTGDQTPAAPEATKTSYLRHDESNAVYP